MQQLPPGVAVTLCGRSGPATCHGPAEHEQHCPVIVISGGSLPGRLVLTMRGEFDLSSLPAMSYVLSGMALDHHYDVCVDATMVTFIDVASVRAIGHAHALRCSRGANGLCIIGASVQFRRVLSLCGLVHLVDRDRPLWAGAIVDLSL